MFYMGVNDQRVSLVDEQGHEVYATDFRNFTNVLTHLRPVIAGIALANPFGEVDKQMVKTLEGELKKEKAFTGITAINFGANMDARFLALVALAAAKNPKKKKK